MIEQFTATLPHGIELSCRRNAAERGPRVVFLHGFPEAAFVWDEVMTLLQDDVQCTAPNLRGFERSSRPLDVGAYRPKHLMADVVALIEQLGAPIDLLVAHDWGGAVAWNIAAQQPQAIKHLFILNSPHPATFLRELRHNPAQQAASAYMNFLCRPDAAALLSEDNFARMWKFLHRTVDGTAAVPSWLTPQQRAQYEAVWSMGLQGGLNYYCASPLKPSHETGDLLHTLELPDAMVTSRVPTSILWGEKDAALLPSLLDGIERWVPQLHLRRLPDAGHWLVHEQPQVVVEEVRRCLGAGALTAAPRDQTRM